MARRRLTRREQAKGRTFQFALMHLRLQVAHLRELHGWTYEQLSAASGVNWRVLVALETGEPANPTLVTVAKLAAAFGVDVNELFEAPQSKLRIRRRPSKDSKE